MAVSSKDSRRSLLDHELGGAVSIVFDFVNPVLALWWLIDQGRKLRLDESKSGAKYAEHGGGKQVRSKVTLKYHILNDSEFVPVILRALRC